MTPAPSQAPSTAAAIIENSVSDVDRDHRREDERLGHGRQGVAGVQRSGDHAVRDHLQEFERRRADVANDPMPSASKKFVTSPEADLDQRWKSRVGGRRGFPSSEAAGRGDRTSPSRDIHGREHTKGRHQRCYWMHQLSRMGRIILRTARAGASASAGATRRARRVRRAEVSCRLACAGSRRRTCWRFARRPRRTACRGRCR